MELPIVLPPGIRLRGFSLQNSAFDMGELMMRGEDSAFPIQIPGLERLFHRMLFEKQAKGGDVSEIAGGHGHDLKAALPLGKDKAFGGESVQDLAKRAYACSIAVLETL